MTDLLDVYLDGTLVGHVAQTSQGALSFDYLDDYRARPHATPLSLSMPLARSHHSVRPTRAYLQGLLPDSRDLLAHLARQYGVSAGNPFALLACMGRDAAGAVQLLPHGYDSTDAASRHGDVRELDDEDFAHVVADLIANQDTWGLHETADMRWSLPGAQPKVALFLTGDGRWAVPHDSTPTTHIVKPAIPPYQNHHINEFMTLAAARHLGLSVADSFIVTTTSGDNAFVSVRYDRVLSRGRWIRLHQEDVCQALAVPPDKKYQSDGGPGVGRIGQLFRNLPDPEDAHHNAVRFFDALAFNLAALGTDAHAKNYSLLLDGDHARLAPLYDLGSHAAYPTRNGTPLTMAMSIDGQFRADAIGVDALTRQASKLGLDAEYAHDRAREITAGISDAYADAATQVTRALGDAPFANELADSVAAYARQRGWSPRATTIPLRSAAGSSTGIARGKTTPASTRGSFASRVGVRPDGTLHEEQ